MNMDLIKETDDYRQFTKPAELHKAINTLKGLVAGITSDGNASEGEILELTNWCILHKHLENRNPFNELIPLIENALEDGVVDTEECQDILWLCSNFVSGSTFYNEVTTALQYFMGILYGVLADNKLTDHEIKVISNWIDSHEFLKGCYPFDEVESLIISAMADGKIDDSERQSLMAYFSNFIDLSTSYNLNLPYFEELKAKYSISGVCAVTPDISIKDNIFCFTGTSYRSDRRAIAKLIVSEGGTFTGAVSGKTNYLIVGNAGSPCWVYACYGRKIENAINFRKQGHKVVIVNETDFWDYVETFVR